ncbi:hypothetical protein E2562_018533 [Oryza meyeriana var. granulata]|uniref:Retroviral polymerase SH3-like domain-containing protein n=1 Tax=Oryza meyeriana var. granulata TaxID=110450 RepID=A0A6G1F952_9ORYZ|nr:hypothetical protein E2562_018533 [Oryza meyeriana var. granulata]
MVFLGYEPCSKAYRVYNPVTKRVCVTRDMVFDEMAKWNWGENKKGMGTSSDSFTIYYDAEPVAVNAASPTPPASGELSLELAASFSEPASPQVEFVSPPRQTRMLTTTMGLRVVIAASPTSTPPPSR